MAWNKLEGRQASKLAITELNVLIVVLNMKHSKGASMEDYVSTREAQFSRLSSMSSSISESMKIALLLSSLANLPEYRIMIASGKTLQR